jgi:UDP-N-acetylglucosamine:LPS N-acetylglucosamine transferase
MTTENNRDVLVLWADAEHGIRSVARTLCGILEEEPHGLRVTWVDVPEALAARSLVQQMASMIGTRLEAAVVSTLGWPAVQERLSGRSPRVVVALDPVSAAAVDVWRGKGLLRAPLVGVVNGLYMDPAWARTAVDRLAVADEIQAEEALDLGLPPECLVPVGVPVCGGFSSPSYDERDQYRQRFGLPADRPVVLTVTHGLELDQLSGVLFQLSMLADRMALMFDVAKDDDGADLLRRRARLYEVPARMFGKVEEAGELWAASDVVLARPHLYVEQRVVPQRIPLICLHPQGELERKRARVYSQRGIGREVHNPATLAAEVELLLRPGPLQEARQKLAEITRRVAADDLARLVAQVGAQAEQILAETREALQRDEAPAPGDAADADGPTPPRTQGPLELIGVDTGDPSSPGQATAAPAPAETLADVEAAEAEAGRQVLEHQRQVERWQRRLELAREKKDRDLVAEAERVADRHMQAMHRALAELARVAEKRKLLEPRGTRDRKLENTFREMEVEDALTELKRKMGWKD